MSRLIHVSVENDHLESLARPSRSLAGVAEMVWNALDAESDSVRVRVHETALGAVETVEIIDNGHGMTAEVASNEFAHLGGSWKLHTNKSKNGERLLHGKRGQGRWRAFSIGSDVRWTTVAAANGDREKTTITGSRSALTEFEVGDPETTGDEVGTTVTIENVDPEPTAELLSDSAADNLTATLALYLERYPNVAVEFRGETLDPAELQAHRAEYEIGADEHGLAKLTVIEWTKHFPRELLLCDENGIALQKEPPNIQAPAFDFTAYVSWQGFREHEAELVVGALHPVLGPVIEAARDLLRNHFRARSAELEASVIEEWKTEEVYPYEGAVSSEIERVEREFFDVVAVTSARAVNSAADRVGKKFSLRLLREAIEQSPTALRRVLHEVLELSEDKLEELDALLDRTSLTSIIALGKVVTDRLDFLMGLRELLFDPKTRKAVLERSQLHRILANEAWIFGDQYTLAVDDQGLNAVLEKHVKLLGRDKIFEELDPVTLEDGSSGIVDMLLSAVIPLPTQEHEHLVVELKRPSVTLGSEELTQLSRYAHAVARDPQFDKVDVRWNFWLIGTAMDDYVESEANQPNLPPGVVSRPLGGRVTIWAKTWSQIIDDCRQRLKFVQEQLAYRSSRDAGVEYLRERHRQYLPATLAETGSE